MSQPTETMCLSLFILLFAIAVDSAQNMGKLNKTEKKCPGRGLKYYKLMI